MLKSFEERSRAADHQGEQTRIVEICLYDRLDLGVRRISKLLLRTPSITTLILNLQRISTFKGNRLFHGINLQHL